VQLGRDRFVAEHRFLSDDEAFAVGDMFRRDHPHRLRLLSMILGWGELDDDDALRDSSTAIALLRSGRRTRLAQVDCVPQGVVRATLGAVRVPTNSDALSAAIARTRKRGEPPIDLTRPKASSAPFGGRNRDDSLDCVSIEPLARVEACDRHFGTRRYGGGNASLTG
jgi:hypothetical protein